MIQQALDEMVERGEEPTRAALKRLMLTNPCAARTARLGHVRAALDTTVVDPYGQDADWRAGALTDYEILARLFWLNKARTSGGANGGGAT